MRETEKIWMNGELVDWATQPSTSARTGSITTGVFEGIRCYETATGPAVFRLTDHQSACNNPANLLYMQLPYSVDELHAACMDVIGFANGLPGVLPPADRLLRLRRARRFDGGNPVDVVIMSWPWGAHSATTG